MRPLIIDENVKHSLAKIVAYAEKHIYTMDDLLDIKNKQMEAAGDVKENVCILPFGYRVVFSIEQQTPGKVRHLSMSVDTPGNLPNQYSVKEIMKIIGFENELEECIVRLETFAPNHQAVNVWELIK